MRQKGKLTSWNDDKGFGFITPRNGEKQVFVHIKSFINRGRRPVGNERLTYELRIDENGRMRAEAVLFHGEGMPREPSLLSKHFPIIIASVFLATVSSLTFTEVLPLIVLLIYLGASIITYFAYSIDKNAAQNNEWRTQESTLHLFALVGGWPGALIAQNLLSHKSKKQSFQFVFWLTVIINCCILCWLFTASGHQTLISIIKSIHG